VQELLTPGDPDISYPFLRDVAAIRQRASQHIQHCTAASAPHTATETVLRLLNEALAIELGRVSRSAKARHRVGNATIAGPELQCLQSTSARQQQLKRIAARIVELGGTTDFALEKIPGLQQAAYIECDSLVDRIEEDLIAERIAVESYGEILQYLGGDDPITRGLFESILGVARRHLEELACTREQLLLEASSTAGSKI